MWPISYIYLLLVLLSSMLDEKLMLLPLENPKSWIHSAKFGSGSGKYYHYYYRCYVGGYVSLPVVLCGVCQCGTATLISGFPFGINIHYSLKMEPLSLSLCLNCQCFSAPLATRINWSDAMIMADNASIYDDDDDGQPLVPSGGFSRSLSTFAFVSLLKRTKPILSAAPLPAPGERINLLLQLLPLLQSQQQISLRDSISFCLLFLISLSLTLSYAWWDYTGS